MNNKEFISALASKLEYPINYTSKLTESFINEVIEQLEEGNTVSVHNFGTFEVKKKAERISVNPTTKLRMLVPPKLAISYKPHSYLKEKFK
ncbi:HU family DNA-binding protein [Bacteroides sp. 224]|uniref:HU family DNA-binding protein n=1 Tax=Bacteroides sp. 224 TaxID=2302936 RepID=UPI0013D13347|nr:HU family DNA-binding protein [Bacteroides sp. 224]NDV64410.1 HU family DNA-binding protein [Bacteroides sp. 224]